MKHLFIALMAASLVLPGCATKERPKEIVARVGGKSIDMTELDRSYVLQPQWKRGETVLHSYVTQIDQLLIQKIYAQEAERLGMDRDSVMTAYLGFIKDKEMIKGLYRREVRGRIAIDEGEARQMYEWMKRKVDFDFVFSRDSSRCAAYARQFAATGADRTVPPADSSVSTGSRKDVKVGDVTPELERALFTARLNEVSAPVRVAGGFMAAKVTGGTRQKFLSDNEFILQRQSVEKLLANRKADSLASQYVRSMMEDKDLRLNAPVFWTVAEFFARRVKEAHVDPMQIQNVNVTSEEIQLLQDDLRGIGDAVVATHRDGNLTVRELMDALAVMPGSLRPRSRTPQNLKDAIGVIVRNQYLLKEARRQGLESDPEVQYEVALQRDETLASAYYGRRRGEVHVTPDDVEAFKKGSTISEEQVFFRFTMATLARDAKTDSVLAADLPRLKSRYAIELDTAKVRSMVKMPDAVLTENPVRIYVREIFM